MTLDKFTLTREVLELLSTVAAEERGAAYQALLDYIFFEKELPALSAATMAVIAEAVAMVQRRVKCARSAQKRRAERDPNAPKKPGRAQQLARENERLRQEIQRMGERITSLERMLRDLAPTRRDVLARSGIFRHRKG